MPTIIRQISPHAARLRQEMTDAEKIVWRHLRNRQLDGFKFRRQTTIGPFVVDFLCVERSLIVEIDGGQHSEVRDAARTDYLDAQGYRIMRFWNHEVAEGLEGVLQTIAEALER
ncbi:MAG: endonuclease domain-containing protein [Sphingobium sp.]|nr:endonuclease domain-containing protein [Sphingobium sp.]